MKMISRILAALFCTVGLQLSAANLKVNLAPSQAVSAGAQWRVDGGTWRASGSTVSGLSNGNHTVDFKAVSGWVTPAAQTSNLSSGTTTLTGTYVQTSALKITLTPSSGQWRIDGGSWQASGTNVSGLPPGNHAIDYAAVSGFAAPAAETVSLTAGQTTTFSRSYTPLAQLKITLTPTTAQWRVDGGAWQASGATVANLSVGSHAVTYSALSGFTAPAGETVTLTSGQSLALNRSYVQLAQLSITLTPTTAQWRVDGGAWQASGATVANLTPGSHAVSYSTVAGFTAPAAENVTLTSGQTRTLTRNYTPLTQITIVLSPATAQWRVDSGAWQASGATVTNLAAGSHTINYAALAGFTAPATESVTLTTGQSLTLNRSYIQLAQISINLTPGTGQWKVDGGAWQSSGATVVNLSPGSHAIAYSALINYASPAAENVTLTAGQSLTLSRSYTQLAQIIIGLQPSSGQWRANGGAWQASGNSLMVLPGTYAIEYSSLPFYDAPASQNITLAAGGFFGGTFAYTSTKPSLRINLNASGQWRVDEGAWQDSGAILTELDPGTHTLDYSAVEEAYVPLPSETITLALRENLTLDRIYPFAPSSLRVTLTPETGMWRASQNEYSSDWQPSGAIVTGLRYSNYNIEYSAVTNYTTPPSENVSVAPGELLDIERTYTQLASFDVSFNLPPGRWRIDGGAWLPSSTLVTGLSIGTHTVDFLPFIDFITPTSETVTLVAGANPTLIRTYVQLAWFSVSLTPDGQWRLDGGAWRNSSASIDGLSLGAHLLEFSPITGFITPASETVTLVSGINPRIFRTYAPLASISVSLNPNLGQWRLDGGVWQGSSSSLSGLSLGDHTLDYSDVAGFIKPPSETVTLVSGINPSISRSYTPLASLRVSLNPAYAQWRVDGGAWQNSSAVVTGLSFGAHTIDYSDVTSFIKPPSETVTLVSGLNPISRSYTLLAALSVSLNPPSAQWRIDGGTWQNSSASVINLSLGNHLIEYSDVTSYIKPPSETVTLVSGVNPTISRSYTLLAALSVSLNPSWAQWRIDGGVWQNPPTLVINLSLGNHLIEYSDVTGYIKPPSETVTLVSGVNPTLSRSYTQLAIFGVSLNPTSAQWRIDGGAWLSSTQPAFNLSLGNHTVEFSDVIGYITPPSETVTLVAGPNPALTRSYTALGTFGVSLFPSTAQWRIDGGVWRNPTGAASNLSLGTHLVEFSDLSGYITPPAETVTVVSGINPPLSRSYTQLATFSISLYPGSAQWRIDGGIWRNSSATVSNLSLGAHTIDYSDVVGFAKPPAETVTLVSGVNPSLSRSYTQLATLTLSLYPTTAQWRVDGGAWQASGATVQNLSPGDHLVDYKPVLGYTAPPSDTINLYSGQQLNTSRYYQTVTQINLTLTPASGQWRVDGGAWLNSGDSVYNLATGSHTIDFSAVDGYVKPGPLTPFLYSGQVLSLTQSYTPAAAVAISLNPTQAQWSVDGGAWQPSGATVSGLYPGYHRIDYKDVVAFTTPAFEMINLPGGQLTSLSRNYTALALLTIKTLPSNTRWRVNGGSWWLNEMTFTAATSGNYTVEYETPATYQAIPTETVTLTAGTVVSLTRSSPTVTSPAAGRLIVHANPSSVLTNGFPQFGVNLSSYNYAGWYFCETTVPLPAGTHYLQFAQGVVGWEEPAPMAVTITSGATTEITVNYRYVHHLKFYLNASLTGGLATAEIERRLTQYVAHINTIFRRETLRTFLFQPYYDLAVGASDPFTGTPPASLPIYNFPLSIYATLTDNPAVGTYGGRPAIDAAGGGGGTDFKWDQIYDPAALVDGSPQLEQYWRQIHHIVRVLELSFGAGGGEYSSLAGLKDSSAVAPLLADTAAANSAIPDSFWSGRTEYWGDPLTANAWANPRIGSPTSFTTLLNVVSFTAVTESLINGNYRGGSWMVQTSSLPNMFEIVVKTIDSVTGLPVAASTVRVWNRSSPTAPFDSYEETVTAGGTAGTFTFAWNGTPLSNVANAKLIKAFAPGYTPVATWVTAYDAQKVKLIEGKTVFEISVSLTPQ